MCLDRIKANLTLNRQKKLLKSKHFYIIWVIFEKIRCITDAKLHKRLYVTCRSHIIINDSFMLILVLLVEKSPKIKKFIFFALSYEHFLNLKVKKARFDSSHLILNILSDILDFMLFCVKSLKNPSFSWSDFLKNNA